MMFKLLFIFQVAILATCYGINFTITKINEKSGLYYETVGDVRFTTVDWRLITYIDVTHFESQRPVITSEMLERIIDTCTRLSGDEETCAMVLNEKIIMEKDELIEKYLTELRFFMNATIIRETESAPSDFSDIGTETLFESLSFNESRWHYEEIEKLRHNENSSDSRMHFMENTLHEMHEQLDHLENQTAMNVVLLHEAMKMLEFSMTKANIHRMLEQIGDWVRYFGLEQDNYIYCLRNIIEAGYLTRSGVMHPEMFTPERMRNAMRKVLRVHPDYTFLPPVITGEDIVSGAILKISKTDFGYFDGKLIMVIRIPLLESTTYQLKRMYALPRIQHLDSRIGSTYIQPHTEYILTSLKHFMLMSAEDLKKCTKTGHTYICKPNKPINDVLTQRVCDSDLVIGGEAWANRFRECDVKISGKLTPYWTPVHTGWLYSLPKAENARIVCPGKWTKVLNISEAGILQLKAGCILKTEHATIHGSNIIFTDIAEQEYMKSLNPLETLPSDEYFYLIPNRTIDLNTLKEKILQEISIYEILEEQDGWLAVLFVIFFFMLIMFMTLPCFIPPKVSGVTIVTAKETYV